MDPLGRTLTCDASHRRISKTTFAGETTVYVNASFEEVTLAGVSKAKHYIRSGNGLIAIMEQVNTVKTMKYVHNDQLGSINVITDATGAVLERLSFDAFGKPRHADGTDATPPVSTQTTRGYTGHKMDAEVGLINMNARLYDPILGRFISADVTIDAPQDMQTYNRYTYVINNPFAHTDPTGNWSWKNFFKAAKPIVAIAVQAAMVSAGIPVPIAGMAGGFINSGNLQGAMMGGMSAVMFNIAGTFGEMVGQALGSQVAGTIAAVAANGLAGGAMSMMQGGEFRTGFITAGLVRGLGSLGGGDFGIKGDEFGQMIARTAIAGTIGGIASKASGGDFWNGFQTGAFSRLFNCEMHRENGYFVKTEWAGKVEKFFSDYVSPAIVAFGDGVSGGWTATFRRSLGTDRYVNKGSATYQAALNVGTAWQIGLTGTFAAANTFLSMSANLSEGDWNSLGVDSITFSKSWMMSGASLIENKSPLMQVYGNLWGYAYGQTAARTLLQEP